MLNKLLAFIRQYGMVTPGDTVVCALSGGADSVALAFGLYLLKDKLDIRLEAAHFNHHLRGDESDRDEAFVRTFCHQFDIPLHVGNARVVAGEKGLEAAAREARYDFLRTLPGKIATAHTADDNAETVLLHLVRGTGLKGLGGITPVHGKIIRPMLSVTRAEVESFLQEYYVSHIEDSSNETDAFLRNRIRHHVMPLLTAENPRLAENLSAMALRLRLDEECLSRQANYEILPPVEELKAFHPALRSRALEQFLRKSGVREPEQVHIAAAEGLVFSDNPSAWVRFPGGAAITRRYGHLEVLPDREPLQAVVLPNPGSAETGGLRFTCEPAGENIQTPDTFTVRPRGTMTIRSRQTGDVIRLSGGTRSLKKLFIDRKIPAHQRDRIPVLCDDQGILAVYSIGADLDRMGTGSGAVTIRCEKMHNIEKGDF